MKLDQKTKIADDLIRYFDASPVDDSIIAAYLFGSSVKDGIEEASDIDLAFLLDEQAFKTDPIVAMYPTHLIAAEIAMQFDKETDVTILNTSSLEVAYEIMVTGKCVYESDSELRLDYEIKIRGMYFDFKPFISELRLNSFTKL